jgi:hypothetical protein
MSKANAIAGQVADIDKNPIQVIGASLESDDIDLYSGGCVNALKEYVTASGGGFGKHDMDSSVMFLGWMDDIDNVHGGDESDEDESDEDAFEILSESGLDVNVDPDTKLTTSDNNPLIDYTVDNDSNILSDFVHTDGGNKKINNVLVDF